VGTLPMRVRSVRMEANTLKLLGDQLRHSLPLEDTKRSKEFRRLIVQLERRGRELDANVAVLTSLSVTEPDGSGG
jgi:hypothetical protein